MRTIVCPGCGGRIEMQDGENFAFCPFCGANISRGHIVDRTERIRQLLAEGWEAEQNKNYKLAENRYMQALELDANIPSAIGALSRVRTHLMDYNLKISCFSTVYDPNKFIYVSVMGKKYALKAGGSLTFALPVGVHGIGIARYSRNVRITDSNTRVRIEFVIGSRNMLEVYYDA